MKMGIVDDINRLLERHETLKRAQEAVENAIYASEEAEQECQEAGICPSHHANMEWTESLSEIEGELREIAVNNIPAAFEE